MGLPEREWHIFDTIKFGIHLAPTSEQLEKWDKVKERMQCYPTMMIRTKYETWLRYKRNSIHVIYYPQDRNNRPESLLLFEMSLPKLVYGDNIHMISSPSSAIEEAHRVIGQYPYIPRVDLNQGILYRMDLCFNLQVGVRVLEWIRQLYKLEYPRRKTKPYYPSQGVQYYSRKASLSFYGKEAETRDSDAHGILRMEASWRDKNRIGKLVGKPLSTIGDFTSKVVVSLLNAELEKLGIRDRAPVDSLATLRILTEKYGSEQGVRLYGHLNARQIASNKEMKAMGILKQTISRSQNQIRDAGLSMCIAENEVALPMLVITPRSIVE